MTYNYVFIIASVVLLILFILIFAEGTKILAYSYSSRIKTEYFDRGYKKGYSNGHEKGIAEGREEGMQAKEIIIVNRRATPDEIRSAYGYEPKVYLNNLRENGIITDNEFDEGVKAEVNE